MQKFTTKIVDMMKSEGLFEWQGGPIILSQVYAYNHEVFLICVDRPTFKSSLSLQIENEFGPLEWDQGEPAKAYTSWAANMAIALNTGVPWIMCKQDDAPDPIVCIMVP